ncbi:hypothetical protein F4780DRAFT_776798 [Xylariomycetidae sp. FL0641]|nr:hypothetical protein F4780DRAFT_776798 [Xylariomycetidae sp. FL0641]
MGDVFKQFSCIPKPTLTERNYPDQTVFLVMGGYTGFGYELCKILYDHNATSRGYVKFLQLDLADLTTIKPAVEAFTAQEQRLDVPGCQVNYAPAGSVTAQGHELQIGTNYPGPYLRCRLLLPQRTATAAATRPDGMHANDSYGRPVDRGVGANYAQSKTGSVFLARPRLRLRRRPRRLQSRGT